MNFKLISPNTASGYSQVYIMVGSGSDKRLEPVAISRNEGGEYPWRITYAGGRSHEIHSNWTLYAESK